MLYNIIAKLDKKLNFPVVMAHCDIPCKIYDPISAQIAALTIIRMVDLLNELKTKPSLTLDEQAQFLRLVNQKEIHGIKVKEEINVIWGDYIKAPQLTQYPELHELVHNIMLASSQAKQHISRDAALNLLQQVNRFSEIFWATKQVSTFKAICPYPPAETIVYPNLHA
ncbi:superoxide dismutase, Ni [Colwellia psychrerythraea]|uniref:Superoxide dismutase, Ni n=1 Tax=Colwellia psychrerythraea TaxID=28229 RepID=A0A099KID1_COLPS|nr:superoxide dismutase, Ni [Colwellia psychrerythraea]KGJ89752.1 superoxide dismutase, Ni [Colwellia psychrerythraea]